MGHRPALLQLALVGHHEPLRRGPVRKGEVLGYPAGHNPPLEKEEMTLRRSKKRLVRRLLQYFGRFVILVIWLIPPGTHLGASTQRDRTSEEQGGLCAV